MSRIRWLFLVDITLTSRFMNISSDENATTSTLYMDTFHYVVREYFLIICSYLFKNDYVFKVNYQKKKKKLELSSFRLKEKIKKSMMLTVN